MDECSKARKVFISEVNGGKVWSRQSIGLMDSVTVAMGNRWITVKMDQLMRGWIN